MLIFLLLFVAELVDACSGSNPIDILHWSQFQKSRILGGWWVIIILYQTPLMNKALTAYVLWFEIPPVCSDTLIANDC